MSCHQQLITVCVFATTCQIVSGLLDDICLDGSSTRSQPPPGYHYETRRQISRYPRKSYTIMPYWEALMTGQLQGGNRGSGRNGAGSDGARLKRRNVADDGAKWRRREMFPRRSGDDDDVWDEDAVTAVVWTDDPWFGARGPAAQMDSRPRKCGGTAAAAPYSPAAESIAPDVAPYSQRVLRSSVPAPVVYVYTSTEATRSFRKTDGTMAAVDDAEATRTGTTSVSSKHINGLNSYEYNFYNNWNNGFQYYFKKYGKNLLKSQNDHGFLLKQQMFHGSNTKMFENSMKVTVKKKIGETIAKDNIDDGNIDKNEISEIVKDYTEDDDKLKINEIDEI